MRGRRGLCVEVPDTGEGRRGLYVEVPDTGEGEESFIM